MASSGIDRNVDQYSSKSSVRFDIEQGYDPSFIFTADNNALAGLFPNQMGPHGAIDKVVHPINWRGDAVVGGEGLWEELLIAETAELFNGNYLQTIVSYTDVGVGRGGRAASARRNSVSYLRSAWPLNLTGKSDFSCRVERRRLAATKRSEEQGPVI